MVPVLSSDNKPLFPCKERRARKLMERGEAKPYYQKGFFCIKLIRKETNKRGEYSDVVLGIDPGSKREAYTVSTEKNVVLNITSNTPDWIKRHLKVRRDARKHRRYTKTPYRPCRSNRGCLREKGRMPPSTKARWEAKLTVIKFLLRILPITIVNVEDIKAKSKKSQKKWNQTFTPLSKGKSYFYSKIRGFGVKLKLTIGFDTFSWRKKRNFTKSKNKLDYKWISHNVDSHSLCEIALDKEVQPFNCLWKLEFLRYHRRQLHVQNFKRGGIRKKYGGTVSLGYKRGSVLRYKRDNKLYYLGGTSDGKISIYDIKTGKRKSQTIKLQNIKIMYTNRWNINFLSERLNYQ